MFKLSKEWMRWTKRAGEVELIGEYETVREAENAMIDTVEESAADIEVLENGDVKINGNIEYSRNTDPDKSWKQGAYTGMACGDFDYRIEKV